MFAQFNKISVLEMLNSEVFLVKEIQFQEGGDRESISSTTPHPAVNSVTDQDISVDLEEDDGNSRRKPSLGEFDATAAVSEEDNGFKTPTSENHKIPVPQQCPPAPRRPKPNSVRKRKEASTPNLYRRVVDLTEEVESLFPRDDIHRVIKKIRKSETTGNHHDVHE